MLIQGGSIAAVGPSLKPPAGATIVDVTGLLVAPGGVDAHTHLDAPFTPDLTTLDDYYTGCRAALAGGTTTLLDFALPTPSLAAGFARHAAAVDADAACDVALHMAVTTWDAGVASELEALVAREGVTSFKMFFSYKGALDISDEGFLGECRVCVCVWVVCVWGETWGKRWRGTPHPFSHTLLPPTPPHNQPPSPPPNGWAPSPWCTPRTRTQSSGRGTRRTRAG